MAFARILRPEIPRRPERGDIVAGLTVAAILVPQALAYALLAGLPVEHGLFAATIPLIAAAPFASSPFLQTGPVAVTALLTFGALGAVAEPGSGEYIEAAALLALLVGVVRLLVGLLRAGAIAYLLSRPMLAGFVPAAAIVIVSSQLPTALGATPGDGGILERAGRALTSPGSWTLDALVLAGATVLGVWLARRWKPLFPGVLVLVVLATLAQAAGLTDAPVVGEVPSGLPAFSLDLPWGETLTLVGAAVTIALVGFAEPAAIARSLAAASRKRWDPNREFVSQGVANVTAGVVGGMPVGGSFGRSALNEQAGAVTPWSGAITGLAVLALLPAAAILEDVPSAVLAAVIIGAVVRLIRVQPLIDVWRRSLPQAIIAWTTLMSTLLWTPHVERGVLLGVALSIGIHLWRELRVDLETWEDGGTLHLRPQGVLWFGVAQSVEDRVVALLSTYPHARRLVLHLDGIGRLDLTGAMSLRHIIDTVRENGLESEVVDYAHTTRLVDAVVLADRCPTL